MNFSPIEESLSVADVVKLVKSTWSEIKIENPNSKSNDSKHFQFESKELQLDSNLARSLLGWRPNFTQQESVISTIKWWSSYLSDELNAQQLCEMDIAGFLNCDYFNVGEINAE